MMKREERTKKKPIKYTMHYKYCLAIVHPTWHPPLPLLSWHLRLIVATACCRRSLLPRPERALCLQEHTEALDDRRTIWERGIVWWWRRRAAYVAKQERCAQIEHHVVWVVVSAAPLEVKRVSVRLRGGGGRRCQVERCADRGFGHRACVCGLVCHSRDDDRERDDKEIEQEELRARWGERCGVPFI